MSKGRRPGDLSRRSRGPLLLAVLVPLSIAAVVLAVSLVRSHAGRSTPAQMPGSLAGPTAVFAGHPPPTDRPLIWFEPRAQRSPVAIQLRATDWELHAMGSLAIRCQQPCWMKASPDGQRLLVGEFPPEGRRPAVPDVVFDATGRRIGTVESGWQTTWADDSRHLCVLHVLDALTTPQPSKSRAQLDLVDPANAAPRIVGTVVGVNGPFIHEGVGIGYWDVPACSIAAGRAVLSFSEQLGIHNVRVIQLATGRTLYARDDFPVSGLCGCPVETMAVSHDGGLGVERLTQGGVRLRDLSTGVTTPLPAGSAVQGTAQGFSWGGHRVVTGDGVVDRDTGRTLWRAPSAGIYLSTSRPGSDDVLLFAYGSSNARATGIIVRSNGSQVALPAGYL